MDESLAAVIAEVVAVLRQAGARFAYLHGSRAAGRHRPDSDIDIAAHFGGRAPNSFDVLLPGALTFLSSMTRRLSSPDGWPSAGGWYSRTIQSPGSAGRR